MVPIGQAVMLFIFTLLALFIFAWLLYIIFGGDATAEATERPLLAEVPGQKWDAAPHHAPASGGAAPEAETSAASHEGGAATITPEASEVAESSEATRPGEEDTAALPDDAVAEPPAGGDEAPGRAGDAPKPVQAGAAELQSTTSSPAARPKDDLKLIEGIGPVMERVLNEAGIYTFADLAAHTPESLQKILDAAGVARITNPETWAEQAKLAAEGRWEELKALQGELKGGRRVKPS